MEPTTLYINKKNEVWLRLDSNDIGLLMSISEHFSFYVPGYRFMQKYKSGMWDGKIRLFNVGKNLLYLGLLGKLMKFCQDQNITVFLNGIQPPTTKLTDSSIDDFIRLLAVSFKGNSITPTDYQIAAFRHCLDEGRSLILSPTSSGKSLIIYLLVQWLRKVMEIDKKILILVPTLSLIEQLSNDFIEYAESFESNMETMIYKIYGGQHKIPPSDSQIVISSWHSLYNEPEGYFTQYYGSVIVDEAHIAKADSIKGIMEKTTQISHKFGFTGSLDDSKTNQIILEGLFGNIKRVVSTADLMERGQISKLKIKCLVLEYDDETKKSNCRLSYQDEIKFICTHPRRQKIALMLLKSLEKQNTLVLFSRINDEGKPLYEKCKALMPDRHILYIAGEVSAENRETIRQFTEKHSNVIIVASVGTMSTGVSITNLHNIIFLSPTKSRIRTLQSIGRVLRKNPSKQMATLYDIVDDLSWKKRKNYTLQHFLNRMSIYDQEQFSYSIHRLKINSN